MTEPNPDSDGSSPDGMNPEARLIADLIRESHAQLDRAAHYVVRGDWSGLDAQLWAVQRRVDRARQAVSPHLEQPYPQLPHPDEP